MGPGTIEQLARELKVLLDVGLRPPKVRARLSDLPTLIRTALPKTAAYDDWQLALAICDCVSAAVEEFGDGPYGEAVADLIGTRSATRGLPKHRRRSVAANDLGTSVPTFIRHWERDILFDIACSLGGRRPPHEPTA